MTTSPRRSVPLPAEVRALLDWWLPRVHEIVRLRSAVLSGGLTLGDFAPGWSDVDVCCVVEVPPDAAARRDLEDLRETMVRRSIHGRSHGWSSGQAVEGPLVTAADLADGEAADLLSPFDRLALARFGVVLRGEAARVAEPAPGRLREQLDRDLALLESWEERSPIWKAGMIHWLARSVVFWRDGAMVSKTSALEREIATGSRFAAAFRLALRIRREGSATAAAHDPALRTIYRDLVGPATRLLRTLACRFLAGKCEDRSDRRP